MTRPFRPHREDYAGAVKSGLFAVCFTVGMGWLTWKLRFSPISVGVPVSVLPGLVGMGLCFMAFVAAGWRLKSGVVRKRGLDVEQVAVEQLGEAADRAGWQMDSDSGLIPGVGNIDALLRYGSAGAVVEIKSYGLRVVDGEVRRLNGTPAAEEVRQVLAQQGAVGAHFQPVLWCPASKWSSATRAGQVLVVTGPVDTLVRALRTGH